MYIHIYVYIYTGKSIKSIPHIHEPNGKTYNNYKYITNIIYKYKILYIQIIYM